MTPELRTAGLFGSGSFLIVGLGGYFTTLNALQSLLYGLGSCLVLAYIGYKIGFILNHPAGPSDLNLAFLKDWLGEPEPPIQPLQPLTGEETFVEEMGPSH